MKPVSGRIRVMGWVLLAGVLFLTGAAARAGSIIGTVTEPDGVTGMQNVTVEAYRDNGSGWDWAASADTGADGTYEIGGLSAGTYRVWFHDWNGTYVGEVYDDVPGSDVWDSGTEIEVGEAETVGGIDASLEEYARLSGMVMRSGCP